MTATVLLGLALLPIIPAESFVNRVVFFFLHVFYRVGRVVPTVRATGSFRLLLGLTGFRCATVFQVLFAFMTNFKSTFFCLITIITFK